MSAADKLRALEDELSPFAFVENESGLEAVAIPLANYRRFQRSLPALIAVVEAAERIAISPTASRMLDLDIALAALDQALGSDRPKPGYDKPMFGGEA